MKKLVAAIDLGTTKVVSIVGEKTESGYRIVALKEAPSKGVMRGEVVNIQNVLESLKPTLEEIRTEENIEIDEVYVGIAGQNIKCNTARISRNRSRSSEWITEKEVAEMEREMFNSRVNAGEKILHVIPQSYNIDDNTGVREAVGMTGTRIEGDYKLFIGKTNSVEHSKIVIERAGLKLKDLVLEPVASAKAVLTEDEMELGVAMVDMGGGTTDLLIIQDNIVRHTAVIPFGGNSITEDLRQGCGVSLRNAEQMKIQYGSCYSDRAPENKTVIIPGLGGRDSREVSFKVIAGIIEARVEEIVDAIMYEIENSGFQDRLHAGIVITGGASQLKDLRDYISFRTGFDARIASPNMGVTIDGCEGTYKPGSSTAVGLVIHGFELEEMKREPVIEEKPLTTELFPSEATIASKEPELQQEKAERPSKKRSFMKNFSNIMIGDIFNSSNEA
ncbi:Cell division protein ftsA [Bacteroidales bacterium CF]|jgi:cell division protein FtsA|nr:Cell division protein ftsA [Bacteroidales bacterium CF]NCB97211.1 cell division protein FtsA [Bacteroidia bacterium]